MRLGTTQLRKRFLRGETIPGMQRTIRRAAAASSYVLTALLTLIREPWLCEACSYKYAIKIFRACLSLRWQPQNDAENSCAVL